jgi:hypothetical protein
VSAGTDVSAFAESMQSNAPSIARASVPSALIRSRKAEACEGDRMMSISTSSVCANEKRPGTTGSAEQAIATGDEMRSQLRGC